MANEAQQLDQLDKLNDNLRCVKKKYQKKQDGVAPSILVSKRQSKMGFNKVQVDSNKPVKGVMFSNEIGDQGLERDV